MLLKLERPFVRYMVRVNGVVFFSTAHEDIAAEYCDNLEKDNPYRMIAVERVEITGENEANRRARNFLNNMGDLSLDK